MTPSEIRAALEDRNLSEVARRLNVTRSYLCHFMKGKDYPTLQQKLESYLKKGMLK